MTCSGAGMSGVPRTTPGRLPGVPNDRAIARSGGLSYGRGQCVNDALMQMDARAARRDFPIPKAD